MKTYDELKKIFGVDLTEPEYIKDTLSDRINPEDMLMIICDLGKKKDSRFVIDNMNREFYTNMVYWFMNDSRMVCKDPVTGREIPGRLGKGLYIAGETGTGKSLALQLLREIERFNKRRMQGEERNVIYKGRDSITVRADEITDEFASTGTAERFKRAFSLAIQDLGSEPVETLYMGNRVNVLRSIIEYRGDRPELQTFITSNLPMKSEALLNRYGERCVSRLREMCNYMLLTGKDRRMNFK